MVPWLKPRNRSIVKFTVLNSTASIIWLSSESSYIFTICSAWGILRCSPVWCICGHEQLSDGWTSNNKQLDEFIKKSQLQTNSANHAYLEWIPFDCIDDKGCGFFYLDGLPTYKRVKLIPL